MWDIVFAILVLLVLSGCGFQLGRRLGRTVRAANRVCLVLAIATFSFVFFVHSQLWIAKVFPLSSVIVLSNLLPIAASILSGVLYAHPKVSPSRRFAFTSILLVAGWVTVVWGLIPLQFNSMNRFRNGVCLQSTPVTCSACSAVTLLGQVGIETDENEMARLCLTSSRGTNLLGIFRGLSLKTLGTDYQVQVIDCEFDELLSAGAFPMLAALGQPAAAETTGSAGAGSFVTTLPQFFSNAEHCVVLIEITDRETVKVGDPALLINPTEVPIADLRNSWRGKGFRLVRRIEAKDDLPGRKRRLREMDSQF